MRWKPTRLECCISSNREGADCSAPLFNPMETPQEIQRKIDVLKKDIEYRRKQIRDMEAQIAFLRDAIKKENLEIEIGEAKIKRLNGA